VRARGLRGGTGAAFVAAVTLDGTGPGGGVGGAHAAAEDAGACDGPYRARELARRMSVWVPGHSECPAAGDDEMLTGRYVGCDGGGGMGKDLLIAFIPSNVSHMMLPVLGLALLPAYGTLGPCATAGGGPEFWWVFGRMSRTVADGGRCGGGFCRASLSYCGCDMVFVVV